MFDRSKRWMLAFAMLLVAAAVAAGCGEGGDGGGGGGDDGGEAALADDQTFRLNIGTDPPSIDPHLVEDLYSANAVNQLFRGLTKIEGEDNEAVPALAEEWEVSEDGLTWTFHLRDDLKWSDGSPLTANDFEYSIKRMLDPETAAPFSYQALGVIKGAAEFNEGKGKGTADDVGVNAVDEQTLEFQLETETPWFPELMAISAFFPVPQKAVEQHGNKWVEAGNMVSNGPFKLVDHQPKQKYTAEKNENYYAVDDITLETLELHTVGKPDTALQKFRAEELDAGVSGTMVSPQAVDSVKGEDYYVEVPELSTQYLYFNTDSPELKDPNVRIAISKALDRRTLTDEILRLGHEPISTVVPPGMPGYETIEEGSEGFIDVESADTEEAERLLEEAGWKDDAVLDFYFTPEGPSSQDIATAFQGDMKEIGVDVKLHSVPEFGGLLEIAGPPVDPKADVILLGWIADYAEPYNFYYNLFTCEGGSNATGYCDPKFDELVSEMNKTPDDGDRVELAKEAEAMLTGPEGAHPAAPVFRSTGVTVVQPWVNNFETSPIGLIYVDPIEIEEH